MKNTASDAPVTFVSDPLSSARICFSFFRKFSDEFVVNSAGMHRVVLRGYGVNIISIFDWRDFVLSFLPEAIAFK